MTVSLAVAPYLLDLIFPKFMLLYSVLDFFISLFLYLFCHKNTHASFGLTFPHGFQVISGDFAAFERALCLAQPFPAAPPRGRVDAGTGWSPYLIIE